MRETFPVVLFCWLCLAGIVPGLRGQVLLPEDAAFPAGSGRDAGFRVRLVQAPDGTEIGNHLLRATRQLNGTLRDAGGFPVENIAPAGPLPDGTWPATVLNFSSDLTWFTGSFPDGDELFPGLEDGGQTSLFAAEVVTCLELPAGEVMFGITSAFERTDMLDDDGWRLYCGRNPRGMSSAVVAEPVRSGPPFPTADELAAGNTTLFTVTVPKAGIYPFRLLYWQQSGLAMLEWFVVSDPKDPEGERVLLQSGGTSLKVWQTVEDDDFAGPYVSEVSPLPDSAGVKRTLPVTAVLSSGARPVDPASVRLTVNGVEVTPGLQTAGSSVLMSFQPDPQRDTGRDEIVLSFRDEAGVEATATWSYGLEVPPPQPARVAGQWDFDKGDLRATRGRALSYLTPEAEVATQFGTTRDFGIPDIAGQPALVMRVPGGAGGGIGYVMHHGIPPNGGGKLTNRFTLIFDILVSPEGPPSTPLLQTDLTNAGGPGLIWSGGNFGDGGDGHDGLGTFTAGEWHRVSLACDLAADPPVITKFVDGIKQADWTAGLSRDDPGRALQEALLLFAGGPGAQRRDVFVNSIQIRDDRLTDAQLFLLSGPEACGIPETITSASVTGQWDFDHGGLHATIGAPLAFLDGPDGLTSRETKFGTPAEFGLPELPGGSAAAPSTVMRVPGHLTREIGYIMDHRILPNGGGTRVNQFTVIMDLYVSSAGPPAAALLQTDSLDNQDDGDLFWQNGNFGQGEGGYGGTGRFTAGAWHRIAAAYDMAANPPVVVKYVDGIKQDEWTAGSSLDHPRRTLAPYAILFADGDADQRREIFVNSIQIRPGRLSDGQLALLGGPSPGGIPVALPETSVTGQWDFRSANLNATIGAPLRYLDGPEGLTRAGTIFDTTAALGIPDIGSAPSPVMEVPGDLDRNIGYIMEHRIPPNGGGTLVNQFTIIMDVMVDVDGTGAASLLQIDSPDNTNDGDLFWQGDNFGQGTGGYGGTGTFTAGDWHRVAAAYDLAADPPVVIKYVDGILQDEWTTGQHLDHPRRALKPTAILFADGDQDERRRTWVSSIQIRSGALTHAQLEALGGPQPSGIPIVIPTAPTSPPRYTFGRGAGKSFLFAWEKSATGWALERSSDLTSWQAAGATGGNFLLVEPGSGPLYFRLRRKP